jgi:hypothetical protein
MTPKEKAAYLYDSHKKIFSALGKKERHVAILIKLSAIITAKEAGHALEVIDEIHKIKVY